MTKSTIRDDLIAKMRHAAENMPFAVEGDTDDARETRKMRAALEVAEMHILGEFHAFMNARKTEGTTHD